MPDSPPFVAMPLFIMKNLLLSHSEVETLRAQVRELRQSVAELENRLADFEGEADGDEDQWGIWPYCHVVSVWNLGRASVQQCHRKLGRWNLTRRNRRYRLQSDAPLGELRLT